MADTHYSMSETEILDIEEGRTGDSLGIKVRRMTPIAWGSVTLDTGGGTQTITDTNINSGDFAIVSLLSDDTGTAITKLTAACSANTITIVRTDDGSSNDDGVANYVVFRP